MHFILNHLETCNDNKTNRFANILQRIWKSTQVKLSYSNIPVSQVKHSMPRHSSRETLTMLREFSNADQCEHSGITEQQLGIQILWIQLMYSHTAGLATANRLT